MRNNTYRAIYSEDIPAYHFYQHVYIYMYTHPPHSSVETILTVYLTHIQPLVILEGGKWTSK